MENGKVSVEVLNGAGAVTFFHPKSNSLPGGILRQIADAVNELSADNNAKIILLKSEGERAFCAGASFDELVSINDFETGKEFFMGFARIINAIRKSPKFVIARVQGKAVGGGVGLAAAADYTLASESASVRLSELALGIGPFVVRPAVERKIGKAAFNAMAIDHDWRTADWALHHGLYNSVFPGIGELNTAVSELTGKLSKESLTAMAELKRTAWEGTEDWDALLESRAEISGKLVLSDFTKNYIAKFKAGKD